MTMPHRLSVYLLLLPIACSRSRETPAPNGAAREAGTPAVADAAPAAPRPAPSGGDVPEAEPAPAPGAINTTPNEFLARGIPTFVLGTAGDDRADRIVAAQVGLVRELFKASATVLDDSIDVAAGASAWPPNPVVYGGPDVSSVVARLAPVLPLSLGPDRLAFGEREFRGTDLRVIAVVPARASDANGPGHPEFLLYAGTGSAAVAEINGVQHGQEPILVANAFGRLQAGRWERSPAGAVAAAFPDPPSPRIAWRVVERPLAPAAGDATPATVRFGFPEQLAPAGDEAEVIDAALRGLAVAVKKLGLAAPSSLSLYVYPDRRSKLSLTGDQGDGYAVVSANVLHVLHADPSPGGPLETLVVHEGTHVLAYAAWGPAGTALVGEGLAVWASGQYGGATLDQWKQRLDAPPRLADLLGAGFRRTPEATAYPLAGLLVAAAVDTVGLDAVRTHLLPAPASTWSDACVAAGTTAEALQSTVDGMLAR
ncbi:MAG: hypothetical protein HY907_19835 [Deltaproteobacteria bacterium]|nr:hypothetical protein [Deltaproteobacteria bacterium]